MKEVRDFYNQFDTCREHDIPLCADACPFKMDFLDVQERIAKKRFNAAYKTIRDCVAFPAIVAKVCPAYCQSACVRAQIDDAVQIKKLEQSCINLASRKDPNSYNLPSHNTKVAVIGAGISGMAFALKMASRKYKVTVFEKSAQVGGKLSEVMAEAEYLADFELQFKHEKYELRLNTEASVDLKTGVVNVRDCIDAGGGATDGGGAMSGEALHFDVVYIATGTGGENFGVTDCMKVENVGENVAGGAVGIFAGGNLLGKDLMHALADGINIATCADGFAKTGNMDYPTEPTASKCVANEDKLIETPATIPSVLSRGSTDCTTGATDTNGLASAGDSDCTIDASCTNESYGSGDGTNTGGSTDTAHIDDATYSEDECVREAERCIRCQCDACETYCDLIDYYEKWPVKMRDEIFLSVKPAGSLVHKCPSRKYIAACTDCKILDDVCPENIDLCGMIKSARHQMHAASKMPAAYKQYYLRDMEFANDKYAAVVKAAPSDGAGAGGDAGSSNSTKFNCDAVPDSTAKYAFFPGCNLGALNPDYVIKPYRWLCDKYPGTGLLLKCCSVPIDWAGNTEAHKTAIAQLKSDWESLGKPILITACMSCDRHLHEYLPEIETITIYELMNEATDADITGGTETSDATYTIFDPCSSRGNSAVQDAVRKLVNQCGAFADELSKGDRHGCCGFGGQGAIAQPKFTQYITEKRIAAAEHPYLVYCANCRDVFTAQGMPAVHIFDLLFDINPNNTIPSPGITERRVNRVLLKERLLKEFWGDNMTAKPDELKYKLIMNDEVAAKVEKLHIIADDIVNVIEHAEQTGRRTFNPETGCYKAYNEIGAITLWVEYSVPDVYGEPTNGCDETDNNEPTSGCDETDDSNEPTSGGCDGTDTAGDAQSNCSVREIHNVYSHRMQIKLEAVFNGRKIDG